MLVPLRLLIPSRLICPTFGTLDSVGRLAAAMCYNLAKIHKRRCIGEVLIEEY
jgi:hypothetical protein